MAPVPEIDFDHFSIKDLKIRWNKGKIHINKEYQRSYIWKLYQQKDLIESIMKGYSIGVLVVWENRDGQFELIDGQQRIRTILNYLGEKPFKNNDNKTFDELSITERSEIEGYGVYYLKLKSSLTDNQVSDIFTRLQEGTPLNIAEKVNALRGRFKEIFMDSFSKNKILFGKLENYRFRARLLAAQFLLLELETDFDKKIFPNMTYLDFKRANEKYEEMSERKISIYNRNLSNLGMFLHNQIAAIKYRDWISLYLLCSFLYKKQADLEGLGIYLRDFTIEFMKNLTSFSIYDISPPAGMNKKLFKGYMNYKEIGRQATKSNSIEGRFNFILSEYNRIFPKIKYKDENRLYNEEEKVKIYFKQNCLCAPCGKPLDFEKAVCHHKEDHSKGGLTRIENGQMVHSKCHEEIHKAVTRA
jgi:hypothetical protein